MLNTKQENFCLYYVETGNQSEAYRRAYPKSQKWKDEAVWSAGSRLLKTDKVSARVAELKAKAAEKSEITREMILEELAGVAFSSITHLHNTWIELKDFESLTEKQKSCIKSISTKVMKKNIGTHDDPEIVDVEYVKIELYDKLKALDSIIKMLGFEAPKKVDLLNALFKIDTGTGE